MAGCKAGLRVAKLQSTKLIQSIRQGNVGLPRLEKILDNGIPGLVNLLHPIYCYSPLIVASCEGNLTVVDVLLTRGADPDLKDAEGRTAVMHAASQGHVDCVVRLIESGASVVTEDDEARGMYVVPDDCACC